MAAMAFRDVVLPLCGLVNAGPVATRQTMLFIAHHSIININNLNLLEPTLFDNSYLYCFPAASARYQLKGDVSNGNG